MNREQLLQNKDHHHQQMLSLVSEIRLLENGALVLSAAYWAWVFTKHQVIGSSGLVAACVSLPILLAVHLNYLKSTFLASKYYDEKERYYLVELALATAHECSSEELDRIRGEIELCRSNIEARQDFAPQKYLEGLQEFVGSMFVKIETKDLACLADRFHTLAFWANVLIALVFAILL